MKSKLFTEKPSNAWTPTTYHQKRWNDFSVVVFKHLSKHKKLLVNQNLHGTLV
jgi:hypothetical protein